jgi:hypothetical protein
VELACVGILLEDAEKKEKSEEKKRERIFLV